MNFYLLTMFDACLNCIFRVALNAISWASGKRQLNYTLRKGNVFYYVDKRFFIFVTFLTFLTFFIITVIYTFLHHVFCTYIYQKTSINITILGNANITTPSYLKQLI